MSNLAKVISFAYDDGAVTKTTALKTYYRSLRLIKISGVLSPTTTLDSIYTNILLCGNCIDYEKRNLYVFYIDTNFNSAWIIEINIDTRVQTVVYYDKYNAIGFDADHRFYNARVVDGRLVWTDNYNPIYQMDIKRAKNSFYYGIGYGQYPDTSEWSGLVYYSVDEIVSNGNNFYKSLIDSNQGIEPKFDDGTHWQKLCLIEDAYYSQNIENFYFEAMPPKHAPVVEYETDDTRKINNLRQTLFQFAYRYVYMDWRKSTFSPASIVSVPQAEEEAATGLSNETPSLNNKLRVTVNLGGEEVRAVEVVARSSEDPSKWYLVETIKKFEEEETGSEVSRVVTPSYINLGIAVLKVNPSGGGNPNPDNAVSFGIGIKPPSVQASYVLLSTEYSEWEYDEYYPLGSRIIDATVILAYATITSLPAWMTVFRGGAPLSIGNDVYNGDLLSFAPAVENKGAELNGVFTIVDPLGNTASVSLRHKVNLAGVTVNVVATIPPPLIVTDNGCTGTYGSANIVINFTPDSPEHSLGELYTLNYTILKNGSNVGTGSFTVYEQQANSKTLTMGSVALNGDIIDVYLQYNT